MRKQYHFRPGPTGLRVWNVDRLVTLAKDLPRELVPLSAIVEIDEAYWSGDGGAMTCREVTVHARLIDEADLSFPVILSPDGRVMDGMHRVAKALLLGRAEVEAVRLRAEPEPDYVGVDPDSLPCEEPDA